MDTDVVIAGGGPTGLMLAGELALAGVRVVVLERLLSPPAWSRAQSLQVRSVETFRQRGLRTFDGRDLVRAHQFGLIPLRGADDPELVAVRVPQREIETALEDRARALGAEIRRGHEVVGLEQDTGGVTVHVTAGTGAYALRGAYLAGCDGGGSAVRRLAGIAFVGGPAPFPFAGITGDVRLAPGAPERVGPGLHPSGMFVLLPVAPGVHRITVLEFGAEPAGDGPPTVEELLTRVRRVAGVEPAIAEPVVLSRISGATLLAERYRAGRVLLAGDAAHVHMPFGGQGLNTGVQDAFNLGWKLAAAVHGRAPAGLLDTYDAERRPVGELVCTNTRAQMSLLYPLGKVGALRAVLGEVFSIEAVSRHLAELLSAVGVRYPIAYPGASGAPHPLQGRRVPHVQLTTPDGPVPLEDTLVRGNGVLLDLSGGRADLAGLRGWAGRVDVVEAEPVAELDAPLVLVRPDGYAAWAGGTGDADGLRVALTTWFGEGTDETGLRNDGGR